MDIDIFILFAYLALVFSIGFMFNSRTKDVKNYFAGGGTMLWWMVGATLFMNMFSAWTFTGAAGKVFTSGFFTVASIFIGNAISLYFAFLYFGRKYRQLRVITHIDAVRKRYGRFNEQVFVWLQVPIEIFGAGVGVYALAIFSSAVFHVDIDVVIVAIGLLIVVMATVGGSWAASAGNFVQMLVMMSVTVATFLFAYNKVGSVSNLINQYPYDFVFGEGMNSVWLFAVWSFLNLLRMMITNNHLGMASRYVSAKDSRQATFGALLACVLMVVAPFIWFLPPMVIATIYTPLQVEQAYSALGGSKAYDAVYVMFVEQFMPYGMIGLFMAAMFASSVSSICTSLNRNTAVVVRNFYLPVLTANKASEHNLMYAGKIITVLLGALIIGLSLLIASVKDLSFFDLTLQWQSFVVLPVLVPLFWTIIIRRIPVWAPIATVIFGIIMSVVQKLCFTTDDFVSFFGLENATKREVVDTVSAVAMFLQVVVNSIFFMATSLFYNDKDVRQVKRDRKFWVDVDTVVVNHGEHVAKAEYEQLRKLGLLSIIFGAFICLLVFVPNEFAMRFVFFAVGGFVAFIGFVLFNRSRRFV